MGVGIPFTRHIFAVAEKGKSDMARYIDVDALLKYIKDIPTWYEEFGIGWHATKYPNGSYDCEDIINSILNARAADVVPRSEVEQLRHKYDLAVAEREANVNGFTEELSKAKAEVAREIFDDINAIRKEYLSGDIDGNELYIRLYQLEKKYTESAAEK